MGLALRSKPHDGTYHRLWLVLVAVIAFLMAALWSQPTH